MSVGGTVAIKSKHLGAEKSEFDFIGCGSLSVLIYKRRVIGPTCRSAVRFHVYSEIMAPGLGK